MSASYSHVEELQERIAVQIQVNQEGNNSSSKIKIVPQVSEGEFVIFLAKKFVLSMIIRIFAPSVLAKPLNNAQIVRGVFCLYTFEYGESYSLYKTVWIFWKSR